MIRASRLILIPILLLCGCTSPGRSAAVVEMEGDGLPPAGRGMARFALDDFGGLSAATLETNALPYRLVAAALVLEEEARTGARMGRGDLPRIYRRFGFLYPDGIGNWSGVARPPSDQPLGLVTGMVKGPTAAVRIEAATLGCASCHAGALYDAGGRATGDAWLGLPNTSLNLDAYIWAVYRGLQRGARDPDALARRAAELFPEMSGAERFTLRRIILPRVRKRIAELQGTTNAPTPFGNGGPGRTNGVAALKQQLGLLAVGRMHPEAGFTSIPELGSRHLRSSLLYDGTFAPRGVDPWAHRGAADPSPAHMDSLAAIVAFFTVPTMGMHPDEAARAIPRVREVMGWLAASYAPPPFPGPVDEEPAGAGRVLYDARCASCHGSYAEGSRPRRLISYPNVLTPQDSMRTDPARWEAMDSALLARLRTTVYARHVDARRTGGYAAPILSGLWATAPYLHNGSVPTLWHLMTPDARPARFQVGGHALDFERMGIAGAPDAEGTYRYPAGYAPWSTPETYDTRQPGLRNAGHEREFAGLSDADKRALIEYLKGL
jgi:mono/diheme cytochrome c family protein